MQKVKPSTLPGFMELLPAEQIQFNRILDIIRSNYERFGFVPLDTPAIERAEILLAKAGGETEQQIYRFSKGDNDIALRFDLTVPLARYVSQHFNSLSFPFRRYQIGKVYRGEKPQKGRFREFYQCDIDIIGDGDLSIINDAELPSIIYFTFKDLGFDNFTIKINNRKTLNGLFEYLGISAKSIEVLRIVDKLEKIGQGKVIDELRVLGLEEAIVQKIIEFINIKGDNSEILLKLQNLGIDNDTFKVGLNELKDVVRYIRFFGVPQENYTIDLTIARGLGYYTGTVYETFLNDYPQLGSICSGGRYDNLAEHFISKKLPGVGVSIGLTRLFYQLNELGLVKGDTSTLAKVLIISMLDDLSYSLELATKLRTEGINTEVFFNKKSLKSQFSYANKLGIPYVIVIGEDEIESNNLTLKDMNTGEQYKVTFEEALTMVK